MGDVNSDGFGKVFVSEGRENEKYEICEKYERFNIFSKNSPASKRSVSGGMNCFRLHSFICRECPVFAYKLTY